MSQKISEEFHLTAVLTREMYWCCHFFLFKVHVTFVTALFLGCL